MQSLFLAQPSAIRKRQSNFNYVNLHLFIRTSQEAHVFLSVYFCALRPRYYLSKVSEDAFSAAQAVRKRSCEENAPQQPRAAQTAAAKRGEAMASAA